MSERVEVRRNEDGTIDEVLLYEGDGTRERCVFHMEQTTGHSWYFNLYPEGADAECFGVWSKRRVRLIQA